ncbi:MAG: hypothetical protein JXA96_09835 [Sedimentisphaerales bacterium]|nr:hypothetical protein [Sedimentisphaerales bacterium]
MKTIERIEKNISCSTITEQNQAPEIRIRKVLNARRNLRSGRYDPEIHLSIAIDRLIEEVFK